MGPGGEETLEREQIWPVRWSQRRRLEFIEFKLLWDGRLNRSDLINFFGISVPQASLDFAKYRELAPGNAAYDSTEKTYVAGNPFAPVLVPDSSDFYLNRILAVESGDLDLNSAVLGWRPQIGIAQYPVRTVEPLTLRTVLRAIRERRTVEITYQSMTAATPGQRKITPHALAFDGFRWHARAFCHQHLDYRDFVLARILGIRAEDISDIDPEADADWHRYVEAVIVPGAGMSTSQRKVVELDYGMKDGRLILNVREALLFYYLKHLGLLYGPEDSPATEQIELANRKQLGPFFKRHGMNPTEQEAI
jgi:hypothetical protein